MTCREQRSRAVAREILQCSFARPTLSILGCMVARRGLAALLLLVCQWSRPVFATDGQGVVIAVPDFSATNPNLKDIAVGTASMIRGYLAQAGSSTVDKASDPAFEPAQFEDHPQFTTWQARHVRFLIIG
jgi:hypothetical protein